MHIRIILNFFEKYKCSSIAFFLQSTKYISNEQSCLKTTGLHDDLLSSLFYFFYFTFSPPISFSLCFPISPSFSFFLNVLSQAFIKHSRKALAYILIICIIYIFRKFMNFCLTKKFMTC